MRNASIAPIAARPSRLGLTRPPGTKICDAAALSPVMSLAGVAEGSSEVAQRSSPARKMPLIDFAGLCGRQGSPSNEIAPEIMGSRP
jgi:hypothetical protein